MDSEELLDWEVDLVPDGNLVLVLTNFDSSGGNAVQALHKALLSKANSTVEKTEPLCTADSDVTRRPKPGSVAKASLWDSDRVRSKTTPPERESPSVRVRIAADHFSRLSPVFRLFTDPSGAVGHQLSEVGQADLALPDDDAAAMIMILLVLFNMPQEVAREVNISLLGAICVLVDKYELHGPLSLHTHVWYRSLSNRIPKKMSEDLTTWLCITHVLGDQKDLDELTEVAKRYAQCPLDTAMLPVPQSILDSVEHFRLQTLHDLRAIFTNLIEQFKNKELTCTEQNFGCECIQLGALELNMARSSSLTSDDFDGVSIDQTISEIEQMEWPRHSTGRRSSSCACQLQTKVLRKMETVTCSLKRGDNSFWSGAGSGWPAGGSRVGH